MIQVRHSQINGYGVFAARDIKSGEVVVHWHNTREVSRGEYEQLSQEDLKYIDIQKEKIFLVGEPERFVNHSCDANTKPGSFCDIAARDITEGEEITADYGLFHNPHREFKCNCGSTKCRRIVR